MKLALERPKSATLQANERQPRNKLKAGSRAERRPRGKIKLCCNPMSNRHQLGRSGGGYGLRTDSEGFLNQGNSEK